MNYPESLTRWVANIVEFSRQNGSSGWLPHEILEDERQYPGLLDDVLTQLGYRAFIKRDD